uniref:centrobin n=1 Tax=Pristiophorus japonicus TaxID=55135 RepID=UPI00398EC87F
MRRDSRLAPVGRCRAMDSALRPEELMSDVEPLPLSAPASAPASPRSARHVSAFDRCAVAAARSLPTSPYATLAASSEVTARLYASLQGSCELGSGRELGSGHDPRFPPPGSPPPLSSSSFGELTATSDPKMAADRPRAPALGDRSGSGPRTQSPERVPRPGAPPSESGPFHRPRPPRPSKDARSAGPMAAPPALEVLAGPRSQRLSQRVEANSGAKVGSRHISEMESVRSHLQNMLKFSQDIAYRDAAVSPISLPLELKAGEEQRDDDSFESDCTSTLLSAKPFQQVSVSPPVPVLGLDEAALFPRYSRMQLGAGAGPAAESSLYEYQILKDTLDKERTRRKHCERQIQTLQNRILELQQQLAVAVSADRKKDIMIEQLDKTLVKVVEGWKKHDTEKSEALRQLQEEQEAVEKGRAKQQKALFNLEHRLSHANQILAKEQQEKGLLEKERGSLEEEGRRLRAMVEAERGRCLKLQGEAEKAESGRLHERQQAEVLRAKLGEEREAGTQREQRRAQREGDLQQQLEREKATAQRESQRAHDAQEVLASVQSELQQLEIELDTAKRDKDNLQMELSLAKARFESQRVKSETEFKVALEQQVTERVTTLHEDSARQTAAVREQHRKQIMELTGQHEQELGKQLGGFKSELQDREEKHRRMIESYELRLAKGQEETGRVLAVKRQLEIQRGEMVTKLQTMMQAHWNEALKVLMTENPAHGHQKPAQSILHYHEVPVYRELNRTLSTSGTAAGTSMPTGDCDLSSSSGVPFAVPASETSRLEPSFDGGGGPRAPGNLVKLGPPEQPAWAGRPRCEPPPDRALSGGGTDSGPLPAGHRESADLCAQAACRPLASFPQAIPLQPAVQASTRRAVTADWTTGRCVAAEAPRPASKREHRPQPQPADPWASSYAGQSHNQSAMFPLLTDTRSLDELSQLLNYSFLSHASFHPLEPQADETMTAAPGPHAADLAEHPFTDDAEDSGHAQYQSVNEGGTIQDGSFESSGGLSFQDHSSQSGELQYYIQMLLDRSPGDPVESSADTEKPNPAQLDTTSQPGGSPVLRDRSNLRENVRPQPPGQLLAAQSGKITSSAVQKVKIDPAEAAPLQQGFAPQSPQKSGLGGVLSPKQITQLSRLLSLHHNTSDRPAPTMDELLTYLRDIQQNGPEGPEGPAASARRSLDQKLNQMARREDPSGQRRVPVSKPGAEKSSYAGKPGKKAAQPAPPGNRGSKSSIWR